MRDCCQSWTRPVGLRILVVALALLCSATTALSQTTGDLQFWTIPIEGEHFDRPGMVPSIADQDEFFDDVQGFFQGRYDERLSPLLKVRDVRGKTRNDPQFAGQVLGQRLLLRELSRFIEVNGAGRRGVEVSFYKWEEFLGVLETLLPDDDLPHVLVAPSSWIAYLAERRILSPLDAMLGTPYLPAALATCLVPQPLKSFPWLSRLATTTANGFAFTPGTPALFALPWLVDLRFLFYWKTQFPAEAAFGNRDDFEQALEGARRIQLASSDQPYVPPFAMPIAPDWELLHQFSLALWGSGGDWMPGATEFLPVPAASDGMSFLLRLQRAGAIAFPRQKRLDLEQQFLEQRLASFVGGPWTIRTLVEAFPERGLADIGIALPPFNTGDSLTSFIGGMHLGSTPRAAGDPLASALMQFLTTEAAARLGREGLALLGTPEALDAWIASLPAENTVETVVRRALEVGRTYPPIPRWPVSVELELTRIQLPDLMSHISAAMPGQERDSDRQLLRDLDGMNASLMRSVYWPARVRAVGTLVGFALVVGAVVTYRERSRLQRRLEELESELEKARERRSSANRRLRHARDELARLRHARDELADSRVSSRVREGQEEEDDESRIAELEQRVRDAVDDLQKERAKVAELEAIKAEEQRNRGQWKELVKTRERQNQELHLGNDHLDQENRELQRLNIELRKQKAGLVEKAADLERRITVLEETISDLRQTITELKRTIAKLERRPPHP